MKNAETRKNTKRIFVEVIFILLASICGSISMYVFTSKAQFAPSGIQGVCYMLEKVTPINVALWGFIINIPLIIVAFFFLKTKYVIYTLIYILVVNGLVILFGVVNMPLIDPYKDVASGDTGLRLICCVFSAILFGIREGFVLKVGGSSGGLDIPSCILSKKFKGVPIETLILILCFALIGVSYLVYMDFVSLLLSVIQLIITALVTGYVLKGSRSAIECKVITKHPDLVRELIITKINHSATVITTKGLYENKENTTILCVINIKELSMFLNEIQKIPETFTYYSEVNGLLGTFRRRRDEVIK